MSASLLTREAGGWGDLEGRGWSFASRSIDEV